MHQGSVQTEEREVQNVADYRRGKRAASGWFRDSASPRGDHERDRIEYEWARIRAGRRAGGRRSWFDIVERAPASEPERRESGVGGSGI